MKRHLISLLAGVALGAGTMFGGLAFAGMPDVPFLEAEPSISADGAIETVRAFLLEQSNGRYEQATRHLTGEALQHHTVTKPNAKLTPDPILRADVQLVAAGSELARVKATAHTKQDVFAQDFHLRKTDAGWAIYSIQQAADTWHDLSPQKVEEGQARVIENYTAALADGNVQQALTHLSGPARLRAAQTATGGALPKQTIIIRSTRGIGQTEQGQLVEVQQQVTGEHANQTLALLYTLAEIDGQWKIYDLRVLEMR